MNTPFAQVPGDVRVVDDVAAEFCRAVAAAYLDRPSRRFAIALSGGDTARRCYERLAAWERPAIDWMATEIYWGDERCLPHDDPASNYRLAREALLERVGGVHALFPMDCDDGADAYHLLLSGAGDLDVIHLGLGADGHTASLFPGSPGINADPFRLVVMNEDPTGMNPYRRITLTFAGIERSRKVLVTVDGDEKAGAFAALCRGADVPAANLPADRTVWIVSHSAAALV